MNRKPFTIFKSAFFSGLFLALISISFIIPQSAEAG